MHPSWLLPSAPTITGVVRDVRKLKILEEVSPLPVGRPPSELVKKKHNRWAELDRLGWRRADIARQFGVKTSTVSKVLVKRGVKAEMGREKRPLVVDGKRYHSQKEAFLALRIRLPGLQRLIKAGRARYVR